MRKKIQKTICVIMLLFSALLIKESKAASASITASSTNIKVGDTVSVTISANAGAWNLSINGGGLSSSDTSGLVGQTNTTSNASASKTYKFTASKAGTYTVSLSGDVTDFDTDAKSKVSKSVTVTVGEKSSNNDNNKKNEEKKSEPTFKTVNETMYATGDINVRKSYSTDSDKVGSLKKGDKVTRTGVGDNGWSKVTYDGGTGYIYSTLLTNTEPKKSDDKSLKSLSVGGAEISPAFDSEITDYSVTFSDLDKLDIKAEATYEKAKVEITGNESLKDGDNTIKITVTAEDGTTRIYTIIATKGASKTGMLSTLKVTGYTLSPAFSPDIKEYKITILDASVNSIDVLPESSVEKSNVEVSGNTNLKEGENVVLVKITSEDGTKTDTYKIIVTKNTSGATAGNTNNNSNKSNMILYGGIGVIVALVIAIIAVIVISKRNAYYDEDEEYEDDEEDAQDENKSNEQDDYSDLYGYSTKSEVKQSENNLEDSSEKEKFLNDSIYGDFSAKANSERAAEEKNNYEDGFNYNAFNSKNIYEGQNNPFSSSNEQKSEIKDVDYYSSKVSEMFDRSDDDSNKATGDAFGYLNDNEGNTDSSNEYPTNDWNDDYKPRKSKGKHAK